MKLEDRECCSLDLAKRLKELRVNQDSLYSFFDTKKYGIIIEKSDDEFDLEDYLTVGRIASAFTVAELGEMLPKGGWHQESTSGGTRVWFVDPIYPHKDKDYTWSEKESNARAKMLIYLIENDLLKSPILNGEPS